jgi:hypothetical protein
VQNNCCKKNYKAIANVTEFTNKTYNNLLIAKKKLNYFTGTGFIIGWLKTKPLHYKNNTGA